MSERSGIEQLRHLVEFLAPVRGIAGVDREALERLLNEHDEAARRIGRMVGSSRTTSDPEHVEIRFRQDDWDWLREFALSVPLSQPKEPE